MADGSDETTSTYELGTFSTYGTVTQATRPLESAARLVCVAGPHVGRSFRLSPGVSVIGRGDVAIHLPSNDVSRNHAQITREGDAFAIEDLGARNRTRVNDGEITGKTQVRYGDRIQIGSTIFVLAHHDELELRVQQLMRLDAMTAAVSTMAHDFNNTLHVIMSGIDFLDSQLPADATAWREVLDDMLAATGSASNLAKRLVQLGKSESLASDLVDVAALVREVAGMARRLTEGAGIAIRADAVEGTVLRGSRDELQQVLLNLCINARDAMPNGGSIELTGRTLEVDAPMATSELLPRVGRYVELVVRDTGTGMSEATLARIFEPFFTTKEPGKGTGLGLASSRVIVKRHGGTMHVESLLGVGTTFRVLLPA